MKPILEPIHQNKKRTITAFLYDAQNFETPWHFHPQHELTYIVKSSGTKFIGDFVGNYQQGELVLLRSNVPHCWKNQVSTQGKAESIVVHWNRGIYQKIPELEAVFNLLQQASRGVIFDNNDVLTLLPQLEKLPSLDGLALYTSLLSILSKLSKCNYQTLSEVKFVKDMPTEFGTRMTKIHDFVADNYHRKVYLRELGELVNLSEQSFARFFAKVMGRPFFTFLNEYRINIATRLLVDTDKSIGEIGFLCGFESPPFFFKKFKKAYGISPAKYRKKFHV